MGWRYDFRKRIFIAYNSRRGEDRGEKRQREGIDIALANGVKFGRREIEYPKNWDSVIALVESKQINNFIRWWLIYHLFLFFNIKKLLNYVIIYYSQKIQKFYFGTGGLMDHTVTSIRISKEIINKLRAMAKDQDRSVNYIINELINIGLQEQQ